MWGVDKKILNKGEPLKKEFIRRIQGEVRKTLKKETVRHLIKPELVHIDPDFDSRAPKDEKVTFTQDIQMEKKKLKTRLDVKLGKTRKVTQITKEICFENWKVQYRYNAQKKSHSFKGDAEMASFKAQVMISSKQKPAISVSRPIKVSESVTVVPSGNCNFENKNVGFGITGRVNKYFTATVFMNRSPGVRRLEYSFKGSIHNIVDIKLHGRTVHSHEYPHASTAIHNGTLIKKLGRHVSVQAGLQYENAAFANPSISFVFSKQF
jgi:hypothetical protein